MKAWCAAKRPITARARWSRFVRRRPRASSASRVGLVAPASSASRMARAETPRLEAVGQAHPLLDQVRPGAGQVAPVAQQLGKPLRVAHVRFPPRDGLDGVKRLPP
jgi:hypothetical protein